LAAGLLLDQLGKNSIHPPDPLAWKVVEEKTGQGGERED